MATPVAPDPTGRPIVDGAPGGKYRAHHANSIGIAEGNGDHRTSCVERRRCAGRRREIYHGAALKDVASTNDNELETVLITTITCPPWYPAPARRCRPRRRAPRPT